MGELSFLDAFFARTELKRRVFIDGRLSLLFPRTSLQHSRLSASGHLNFFSIFFFATFPARLNIS